MIESALLRRLEHLSYPVEDPTSAGPREFAIARELDFNGEYQQLRYVEVPLSDAATAIVNKFRRVDAA